MDRILYISEKVEQACHAGSKARMDVEDIVEKYFKKAATVIPPQKFDSRFARIKYIFNKGYKDLLKLLFLSHKKVFMQYPYYYGRVYDHLLYGIADNNKVILLIHDLLSMRDGLVDLEKEVMYFNKCYALIVHNDKMKEYLLSKGVETNILVLQIFDYLLDAVPDNDIAYGKPIVFAGNLNKSAFIKSEDFFNLDLKFNLYGPCENQDIFKENICYKGCYKPDEVPYKLEGSFGLIWDGDSIDECSSSFGNYLKYNTPHKLSLYIASGLPVIVWDESAMAGFVMNNSIGISVSSLSELEHIHIDETDYELYKKNIMKMQRNLIEGKFTNTMLKKIAFL